MLIFACLLFILAQLAHAQDKALDPSHRTILRLVIGDSASHDIYSKMGPSIPIRDNSEPSATQLCYVSDRDDTLVVFYSEFSRCGRVRLLSQKKWFRKWHFCSVSPLVSRYLTTASGIKLGMSKRRLKAILGPPRSETDETLEYVYEWRQDINKTEIEAAARQPQIDENNHQRTTKAAIRAVFSDVGLISFDLSQSFK
jgi:hypothetical protein